MTMERNMGRSKQGQMCHFNASHIHLAWAPVGYPPINGNVFSPDVFLLILQINKFVLLKIDLIIINFTYWIKFQNFLIWWMMITFPSKWPRWADYSKASWICHHCECQHSTTHRLTYAQTILYKTHQLKIATFLTSYTSRVSR